MWVCYNFSGVVSIVQVKGLMTKKRRAAGSLTMATVLRSRGTEGPTTTTITRRREHGHHDHEEGCWRPDNSLKEESC